jgi:hypothetical protein
MLHNVEFENKCGRCERKQPWPIPAFGQINQEIPHKTIVKTDDLKPDNQTQGLPNINNLYHHSL